MEKIEEIVEFLRKKITTALEYARSYAYKDNKPLLKRWVWFRIQKHIRKFLDGGENRLILLPGIRGVGKTTLLSQLYLFLTEKLRISREKVLFISIDEISMLLNSSIYEIIKIYEEKILGNNLENLNSNIFLLLDETHYDKNWAITLKNIYDRSNKVFIVATGSSALSLQTTTDLARRAYIEEIFPLNFSEYLMLKYLIKSDKILRESIKELLFNPENFMTKKDLIESKFKSFLIKFSPLEVERYLKIGGFPFSIYEEEENVYQKIIQILNKVALDDVQKLGSFEREVVEKIPRMFLLLATSPEINFEKISRSIGLSKDTVSRILQVLEASKILFSIKPLGSEVKIVRKAWRYHFITSSIRAALKASFGLLKEKDKGILLEDYVASILYRLKNTYKNFDIFYDSEKGGANFIILPFNDKPIPLEIGYGDKSEKQVISSMKKFNSKFGILISEKELKFENNILYIPKELFFVL
jgi:predicted AAA+ superfamily ATPase